MSTTCPYCPGRARCAVTPPAAPDITMPARVDAEAVLAALEDTLGIEPAPPAAREAEPGHEHG